MLRKALSVLSAGALAAGLVVLSPAGPAAAADIWQPPDPRTGTVRGTFTDRSGEPVAGATVYANNEHYNGWDGDSDKTDAQGRYQLDNVPAGQVTVTFDAGDVTQYAPGGPRSEAGLYTVVPGLTTVVDERQVPTGAITGRFTDATGAPLAEFGVWAYTAEFGSMSARTDADGRYTFPTVPAGSVKIEFTRGQVDQWVPGKRSQETAKEFQVRPGQTLTLDDSLLPTGTLTGQITNADGTPAGVSVSAHETDGYGYFSTSAGADGRFTLAVPPGQWRVKVGVRQFVPGKIRKADGRVFRVASGETVEVDDTLKPTGSLTVKLRTGGSGVGQYSFNLWSGGEKVAYLNGTDAGSRTFEDLLPGDYVFQYDDYFAPGTLRMANAVPIKVRAGRTKTLTVNHPENGTLSGHVTLPDGSPAPGLEVRAQVFGEGVSEYEYTTTTTGTDGEWQLTRAFPETYRIRISDPSRQVSQEVGEATVTSGDTTTVDATWHTGGTLTVTAADATSGAPISGFCVAVVAKFGSYCTEGTTVKVAGMATGRTLITLTPLGSTDYLEAVDVPATVAADGAGTVSVPLTLGGRFNAQVVDRATGQPLERACLRALEPGAGGDVEAGIACTNGQGKGTSQALPPGTYQVFADAPEYSTLGAQWVGPGGGTGDQREATKIKIKPGRTTKLDTVLMDRAGTISGVLRGPDGQPSAGVNVQLRAFDIPGKAEYPRDDTDSQGRYTVENLGPYAWPLLFTPRTDLPRQWSGAAANRFLAATVPVTSGVTSTYDTTLSAGARLTGTATMAPGDTAWSGGRLKVRNAVTGDLLATPEVPAGGGRYSVPVIGGAPAVVEWYVADPVTQSTGWYDGAADSSSATRVPVPATGTKRLDLTVGPA